MANENMPTICFTADIGQCRQRAAATQRDCFGHVVIEACVWVKNCCVHKALKNWGWPAQNEEIELKWCKSAVDYLLSSNSKDGATGMQPVKRYSQVLALSEKWLKKDYTWKTPCSLNLIELISPIKRRKSRCNMKLVQTWGWLILLRDFCLPDWYSNCRKYYVSKTVILGSRLQPRSSSNALSGDFIELGVKW